MNILQLIESSSGNNFKKKASTHGGEYSGPCPWCDGDDRFSIHPKNDHFVCRKCKRAGDSIKFLMEFSGKTYPEACNDLGISMKYTNSNYDHSKKISDGKWEPRADSMPDTVWQEKASAYLFQCFKFLMSPAGSSQRRWLNERGLSNDIIKTARIGYNFKSVAFDRESWGLTPEKGENGKDKQIWIPAGIVIPCFANEKLIRLRIRQSDPIGRDRFLMVPGSSMNYLDYTAATRTRKSSTLDTEKKTPVIIVEAELDGWVLYSQAIQANIPLHVFSIGNSSARPNISAHEIISVAPRVNLSLDIDEAGDAETIWWRNNYIRSKDLRPAGINYGKDPGEWFENGFDFSEWLNSLNRKTTNCERVDTVVESFFDTVPIKAFPQKKQKEETVLQDKEKLQEQKIKKNTDGKMGKICIHGHPCHFANDNICLKTKENIFTMTTCPAEQWYSFEDGMVKQIILGVRYRK